MDVATVELKCLRCLHTWTPRGKTVMICPKCKSPRWNIPKEQKKAK